jgi:TPR repeat protein
MMQLIPARNHAGDTIEKPDTAEAMLELGLYHCLGREKPIDFVAAHKWFNLAAMRGNESARRYRADIAREMSLSDIAEAQRQARAWIGPR